MHIRSNLFGNFFKSNLHKVFAPLYESCIICVAPLAAEGRISTSLQLCRRCYTSIPWIAPRDIRCPTCGRYEACPDCPRRIDTQFVGNRSAVRYNSEMKEWLSRLKYRGDERLQLLFARMMGGVLERLLADNNLKPKHIAFITYVPLSAERLAERGFNQTELIARTLGTIYKIPVQPALLRTRHTGKQSYKSRSERLRDLSGIFVCNPQGHPQTSSSQQTLTKNILLIDDVYTTGSTLNECARALRQPIDAQVYGLTWAR